MRILREIFVGLDRYVTAYICYWQASVKCYNGLKAGSQKVWFSMGIEHVDPNGLDRWERIDGVIYDMSPAPSSEHQRLSRKLTLAIGSYLHGRKCELFYLPFDVYLNADEKKDYVQPDL
jgi:hypothetical protein